MQRKGSLLNRTGDIVCRLLFWVVSALFLVFISWLLLLSACSTSYLSYSEHTYFVKDSLLWNGAALVLCLAALALLHRKKDVIVRRLKTTRIGSWLTFERAKRAILLILLAEGVLWVLVTQFEPGADQSAVLRAATGLRMKSSLLFSDGAYISKSPHQIGLVVLLYALGALAGDQNIVVFQLLNAVGLMIVFWELSEISGLFGMNRRGQLLVAASGLVFFPLTMYTSLIYGNILGEAFALAAIRQELLFLRDGKQRSMLLSVLWIALAVIMKQNYLIFLVGMVLYALVQLLRQKKRRVIPFVLAAIVACAVVPVVPKLFVEWKTGYDMDRGMSSWSFVAMGLQKNDTRCDGWYNSYNDDSFFESGNDPAVQSEMAKEDIRESLRRFADDPAEGLSFFARKTASQWNNPTFQCFWIVQSRESMVRQSGWLRSFLSIPVSTAVAGYLNILQFLILAGCLFHLLLGSRTWRDGTVLLEMLFVGGFLFHLLWEAKGQYTLSYFLLLLPCASAGYQAVWNRMGQPAAAWTEHRVRPAVWALMMAAAAVSAACVPALHDMAYLNGDTQTYAQYVEQHVIDGAVPDGTYRLSAYRAPEYYLSETDSEAEPVALSKQAPPLYLVSYSGVTGIRFVESGWYLQVDQYMAGIDERTVTSGERNTSMGQEWKLKTADEADCVYLLSVGDSALTYDAETGEVTIAPFDESDAQKWRIETGS